MEGVSAMNMYFLGVDPSATGTGLTLLSSGEECFTRLIRPGKLRDCKRLQYISEEIKNFVGDTTISLGVYESPSYGSVHKEFILGEVLGVIKLTLTLLKIPLVGSAPTQLKKYLTGSGSASKDRVMARAMELGCPVKQEDICDSYAAALLCKDLWLGPQLNTRASREVRAALTKKHPKLGLSLPQHKSPL
jgi:Holliday junction resolvasome RuvABC endonuclease subunit